MCIRDSLNRFGRPGLRALRTERSTRLERSDNAMAEFGSAQDLYFGGDMEAALALGGQVVGRIDAVRSVADILHSTIDEFRAIAAGFTAYLGQ